MAVFDPYFRKLADQLAAIRQRGESVREFDCPRTVDDLLAALPIRVGPGSSPRVVLRSETFVELGGPDAGSSGQLLWTEDDSLVQDGRVTLVGPDIPASEGASLPYGQAILVAGSGLTGEEHELLERTQYVADRIEGYMVKTTSERLWSRVSRDAVTKGFNFKSLGSALMAIFKSELEKLSAVELVFVTSSKEDVQRLEEIATQVRSIGKNIVRENWLARGYDILECTLGWDCSTCPDRPVCDDIREVIKIRKKRPGNGVQ